MYLLEREIEAIRSLTKHMPGRHDQMTHGNRFRTIAGARRQVRIGGKPGVLEYDDHGNPLTHGPVAPPPGHQTVSGKNMSESELLQSATIKDILANGGASSTINPGDDTLAHLFKEQGFDGKPDLVTENELNAAIAGGEREFYRAVYDDGSNTFTNAFKQGDYYAGHGIYGNGTYMAYTLDPSKPDNAKLEAGDYGSHAMHISLKKDAKLVNYTQIKDESDKLAQTTRDEITHLGKVLAHKKNPVKIKALNEEIAQKKALLQIYSDTGRYAVSKGYDGYDVSASRSTAGAPQAGYFVLLNRTAVRVSQKITRV